MKKVLLVLAMAGVLVACGNKKKEDKPTGGDDTAAKTTTTPPANNGETTPPASGTPTFADAEVQKYVDDYTAFVNSYLDAVKGKNVAKMTELSQKASEWTGKSASVAQKLSSSPDEAKKFSDYMTKLSSDWAAAMQEAAKAMMPTSK